MRPDASGCVAFSARDVVNHVVSPSIDVVLPPTVLASTQPPRPLPVAATFDPAAAIRAAAKAAVDAGDIGLATQLLGLLQQVPATTASDVVALSEARARRRL
jgi:hypothetical protein